MLHCVPTTISTQDDLHTLAIAGALEGTAVVADVQTVGRGSRGRRWTSPAGGLWLSVLCRPETEPALEVLSLRMALAVCETLEAALPGLPLRLKWPNDLVLHERKLGGILCEARWQGGAVGWVAVGIGLNLRNEIPIELSELAISLRDVMTAPGPGMLAPLVAKAIVRASRSKGVLSEAELAAFRGRDWLAGRQIVEPAAGRASGITPRGELQVADASGLISLHRSGTVVLGATPG
ncbi:MAG: biotin--[acetyl-CoA-carboxylase] ligase [Gemmatimonadota bacterium]|nr:biotin--[acetyl-CoA-carboxylase] ligase [Gemmatimonadota bacterium]